VKWLRLRKRPCWLPAWKFHASVKGPPSSGHHAWLYMYTHVRDRKGVKSGTHALINRNKPERGGGGYDDQAKFSIKKQNKKGAFLFKRTRAHTLPHTQARTWPSPAVRSQDSSVRGAPPGEISVEKPLGPP